MNSLPGVALLRALVGRVRRLVAPHDGRDNSAYWRGRASARGSAAVLWLNPGYNRQVRAREFATIGPLLRALPLEARVLDIGCGIGEVARWLLEQRDDLCITGVDFPEMVERAARELPASARLEWVGASADAFERPAHFDLVLSSGCYSAIRDRAKCEAAIAAGCRAVKPGGLLVMIDPFHRWKYLARVRVGPREVIELVGGQGLMLERAGGILFWPLRDVLANSNADDATVARWFARGERWLGILGEQAWSDYKVLVFRRPADS
jgi:SAM-dependent methyltransferase